MTETDVLREENERLKKLVDLLIEEIELLQAKLTIKSA